MLMLRTQTPPSALRAYSGCPLIQNKTKRPFSDSEVSSIRCRSTHMMGVRYVGKPGSFSRTSVAVRCASSIRSIAA
jgi:hypothetical protein